MEDRVGLRAEQREVLLAMLEAQHTLEDVVRRVLLAGRMVHSVVVQDEYTHDVVVPFQEHFLVYDAT